MTDSTNPVEKYNDNNDSLKKLTMVIYGLQAAAFLIGITGIVAVIMNYIKKDEVSGTWLESHFRWQIRTFWFGLLWSIIGVVLSVVLIGMLVLFIDALWIIYRIVKGWLNLSDNKPMYAD